MTIHPVHYFSAALSVASAVLVLAFGPSASASIVGSTYDFTTSESGNTVIAPLGGPNVQTDPDNPGFCVGSTANPPACATDGGVSGSFSFSKVSPTLDKITFSFFGATVGAGPGTFDVDLGHFTTVDGEAVSTVSYVSGNFIDERGDFSKVTFNGTDAVFTGTASSEFDAAGGTSVIFIASSGTTAVLPVPEPASVVLFSSALMGCGLILRRRGHKLACLARWQALSVTTASRDEELASLILIRNTRSLCERVVSGDMMA